MHVLPRPIRPILRDAEATKVGVTHAQYRFARNPSQLQDGKPLTTEGVKRVSNLNRSQRLLGPKCSPTRPCQPSPTGLSSAARLRCCPPSMSRTFCPVHSAADLGSAPIVPSITIGCSSLSNTESVIRA